MRIFPLTLLVLLSGIPFCVGAQSATQIVTEAYEDILERKPDSTGLRDFRSKVIENGWSAQDVRKALKQSDEYADLIITRSFEDVLGRKPDPGALKTYRPKIKSGWSEKDLRSVLRKSDEYKQKQ